MLCCPYNVHIPYRTITIPEKKKLEGAGIGAALGVMLHILLRDKTTRDGENDSDASCDEDYMTGGREKKSLSIALL